MASRVLRNRAPWRCGGKLRQLASVLVGSGVCIEDLTSLAVLFRDGLMIALLVQRPFRVANFTTITLDRHLQKRGDVWWLCFDASETKGDNAIECRWPEGLVEGLERYLDIHRQRLLRNPSAATPATPALWISQQGRPMSSAAVEAQIGDRTRETFGKPINPHAFRHIAATMIATSNPEGAADIMAVLGHVSMATSEKYYNRATMIAAGNSVQATIAELRGQG
jgi:integrase